MLTGIGGQRLEGLGFGGRAARNVEWGRGEDGRSGAGGNWVLALIKSGRFEGV